MGSFLQFLAFLSVTIVAVFLLADGDVMWRFMREFSLDSRDFRKGHELLFSHWYFSYPVLTVVVLIGQYLLLRAGDVFHDYYSQKNIGAFVTISLLVLAYFLSGRAGYHYAAKIGLILICIYWAGRMLAELYFKMKGVVNGRLYSIFQNSRHDHQVCLQFHNNIQEHKNSAILLLSEPTNLALDRSKIKALENICLDRAESISRRETSLFESINDTYQKEAYQKNRWKLNQLIKEVCVSYEQQKECRVELEELVKESNHLAPYLDEVKQQLFTEKRDREEKFKKQLLEFDKELDQQGKMAFEEFQNKKKREYEAEVDARRKELTEFVLKKEHELESMRLEIEKLRSGRKIADEQRLKDLVNLVDAD